MHIVMKGFNRQFKLQSNKYALPQNIHTIPQVHLGIPRGKGVGGFFGLEWRRHGGGGGGAVFSSTFPDGKELVLLQPSVQPAPSWLDSSTGTGVAEVMGTGIAEVMGSNPIQA